MSKRSQREETGRGEKGGCQENTTQKKKGGVCPECGVNHRGLCHQCVHDGKVGGTWEHSPCRYCQPAEALQQGHGRNLSYDELQGVLGEVQQQREEAGDREPLEMLREFLGLDAVGREIVFRFLIRPESSLQEVADHLSETFRRPYTLQAVHWRIRVMQKRSATFGRLLERVDVRVLI